MLVKDAMFLTTRGSHSSRTSPVTSMTFEDFILDNNDNNNNNNPNIYTGCTLQQV